ncbi:MAG: DegV family protein [Tissierellia bacterium]|nr:DegV family protein [Tissierellia bacterium]
MKYKIIADSSCDLTEELKQKLDIELIPFVIDVDEVKYTDDENFVLREFIDHMNSSPNPIKTACASPGLYAERFSEYKDTSDGIFVITISSKLSGSYNSAEVGKQMYLERYPDKKIHIIDSLSASAGETLLALKLKELIDSGLNFEEVVEEIEKFKSTQNTMFSLESLDNLIKNGRITKTKGLIANVLSIKPVMKAVSGEIEVYEMARGVHKSLKEMAAGIGVLNEDVKGRTLVIAHVQDERKAEYVKEEAEKLYDFKEIIIVPTAGLSSGYAADKGIVISF